MEFNKKYFRFHIISIIIFSIFLYACDGFNECFESDDFNSNSEYDSFIVGSSSSNCYYDQTKSFSENNNSSGNVIECLGNDFMDEIGDNYVLSDVENNKCSSFDPLTKNINKNVSYEVKNQVFNACLESCINKCDKSSKPADGLWTKANLKTDSNYIGIKLKKDTYVTITVNGQVTLSNTEKEKEVQFKKYFTDDIAYNLPLDSNPITNFSIDVIKNYTIQKMGDISDLLDISYMDLKEVDSSIVVNGDSVEKMYEFIKPKYSAVKCDYAKPNKEGKNSVSCSFNYKDYELSEDEVTNLNNYYNKNYKTSVFSDGDYYKYSNDIFNVINSTKTDDNYGLAREELSIESFNNKGCIKLYNSDECSGYIVTKNNIKMYVNDDKSSNNKSSDDDKNYVEFSFKLEKASKISLKYIGDYSGIENNCTYTVIEKYEKSSNDFTNELVNEYENQKLLSNKKWVIINDNNRDRDRETIFNEFSTIDYPLKTKVKLKIDNSENCYSGILIKVTPLKEFKVEKTGFMFFSVPGFPEISDNLKYRIINPKSLRTLKNDNEYVLKDKFYERVKDDYTVNSNLVNYTDNITISNDNYFVRKGQIIRFDYSNFFTFDDNVINLKRINHSFDYNDPKTLDYLIGLNVFINEKRQFFCYKKAKEDINLEKFCSKENGEYQTINLLDNNSKQVCYISNVSCNAPDELMKEYYNLDYKNKDCNSTKLLDQSKNNLNIYDLWDKVYTDYIYITSLEGNDNSEICVSNCKEKSKVNVYKKCIYKYRDLIDKIYEASLKCKGSLNINEYEIYFEDKDFLKEERDELPNPSEVIDLNGKINYLSQLFKTNEIELNINVSDDILEDLNMKEEDLKNSKSKTYKSSFFYYKKPCSSNNGCQNEVTQCYNADNLNVSLKVMYDYIKNNYNIETIGLSKLQSFDNSSKKGLMKNFLINNNNLEIDDYYTHMRYDKTFYPENNSFLRILIINNLSQSNIEYSYIDNFTKEMNQNGTNNKAFFKIVMNKKTIYKNGQNLAAFIGCSSKYLNYKGDQIISDNNKNILPIVSYKKNTSDNSYTFNEKDSLCKFDSSGRLVDKNNNIGINFSNKLFEEYSNNIDRHELCSDNEDEVFFFKIIDIDSDYSNNSGNYDIRIRAVNNAENTIISYFKSFFNTVLSFIDGSYVILKTKNGQKIKCTDDSRDTCYIYNKDYTENNGDECTGSDNKDCYLACESIQEQADSFLCEKFSDGRGFVKNIYLNFINDPLFQFIAKMSLALAITLYGFGYFLGLSSFTQSEIVTKLIRFCAIYFLISPSGWNFFDKFVVKFFKDGIDSVLFLIASAFELDTSSELSIAVASNNYTDKSVIFSTCFSNLELLFSAPVFNKMLGLAFSSWYGLIYLYLVLMTVINYIVGVFSAIVMYLTSQIYMSLVFCFFPLVLLFMFFEKTKKTFDNWLSQLIGFAGQQIFLVMTISFFNILIYNYIKSVFSYRVCWLSIFNINIAGFPLGAISFWKIPSSSATSGTLNTIDENAPSFYSIMSFYIIGILMSKFITGAAELGSSIFGGTNIAGGVAGTINGTLNKGAEVLNKGMKNTGIGFYKGVANRLGGKGIEDYNKKRKEETEARRGFAQSINSEAEARMANKYSNLKKGSKEYEEQFKKEKMAAAKIELGKDSSVYADKFKKFKQKNSDITDSNELMEKFINKNNFV